MLARAIRRRRRLRDVYLNSVLASGLMNQDDRRRALIDLGFSLADDCLIRERCWFGGTTLEVGQGSSVNVGCFFDLLGSVTIGDRCDIGMNVSFITSSHELGEHWRRAGAVLAVDVVIGDGCWIGAGAMILPGVAIGQGCIVAGGSVVNRSCERDGLYAGNPARRIKDLIVAPHPGGRPRREHSDKN